MIPFNWFDVLLCLILLASAAAGLRSGLARVVVGLIAVCVGFLAAFWCYRLVAIKLSPWIQTPALAQILGFLLVFIAVLLCGSIVAAILSRVLSWIGLSWFNHFLGGAVGLLRGALIAAVLVNATVAFSPSPPPAFLSDSRLLPYTTTLSAWLVNMAPHDLKDAFDAQLQTLREFWTSHQKPQRGQEI
jgi:membrane protein required for colicin V production